MLFCNELITMSDIVYNNGNIIIAKNDAVHIYNLFSTKMQKLCLRKRIVIKSPEEKEKHNLQKENTSEVIQSVAVSKNGQILAVETYDKNLNIYKQLEESVSFECVKNIKLQRGASAIDFSSDSRTLFFADKAGDVYSCNDRSSWDATLLLGHLSILLDIIITPDDKFLITCDRDEKIRITCYPSTFRIHSYCLGHTEFVSSLVILPHDSNVLLSSSGDSTLRGWWYVRGEPLMCIEVQEPLTIMKGTRIKHNLSHIVVALYKSNMLKIYAISTIETDGRTLELQHQYIQTLELDSKALNFSFDDGVLWILLPEYILKKYQYDEMKNKYEEIESRLLLEEHPDVFVEHSKLHKTLFEQSDDFISTLFKKNFHNLDEYHKKKKLRIESKVSN